MDDDHSKPGEALPELAGAPSLFPGPSPMHPKVLRALAEPPMDHRSSEYGNMLRDITTGVSTVLGAGNMTTYVFPSSGTHATEAALANLLDDTTTVVVPTSGHIGARMLAMAQRLPCSPIAVPGLWDQPIDLERLASATQPGSIVLVPHVETSTGRVQDLKALGTVCRERDAILVVDAIASVGAIPVDAEQALVDVVVATSQKGLGAPAGLGIHAVGGRAWERRRGGGGRHTLAADWEVMRREYERDSPRSPWTPSATLMKALHAALQQLLSPGLTQAFARCERLAKALREGLLQLDFLPYGDPRPIPTPPIAVVRPPGAIPPRVYRDLLRRLTGVEAAWGQGKLRDEVLRFSILGYFTAFDVLGLIASLQVTNDALELRSSGAAEAAWRSVYRQ